MHRFIVRCVETDKVLFIEGSVVRSKDRYYIYPLKQYQEKIAKLHGKRVKALLIIEE